LCHRDGARPGQPRSAANRPSRITSKLIVH
jgi:hypothetical protein